MNAAPHPQPLSPEGRGEKKLESAVLPLPLAREVESAYQRFESAWRAGERPLIEDHLRSLPARSKGELPVIPVDKRSAEIGAVKIGLSRRGIERVRPDQAHTGTDTRTARNCPPDNAACFRAWVA